MSWNVIICTSDGFPLGSASKVKKILDDQFPTLEWQGDAECTLPVDKGFRLELGGDPVQNIWSHGGFYHLQEFANICKVNGWSLGDAQEGEALDLNDPYSMFPAEDRPYPSSALDRSTEVVNARDFTKVEVDSKDVKTSVSGFLAMRGHSQVEARLVQTLTRPDGSRYSFEAPFNGVHRLQKKER
jgi:hypothetical protein